MNLVIIHGDNAVLLGKKLSELKARFDREAISQYSLKSISFDQLLIEVSTPSLFSEKRLVIVEDVDEKKVDLEKLKDDADTTIVLCFSKELTVGSQILKMATPKKAQVFAFSQPQDKLVFQFLDLIGDKNSRALGDFELLYPQFGGQYLLTMLLYMLRRMIVPAKNTSFNVTKTERQKRNFPDERIKDFYAQILETDFLIKSGKSDEKTALFLLVQKMTT